MLSTVIPVALLSLFPHQEPRFLIPILLPLAYLHAPIIFDETETAVVKVSKRNKRNLSMVSNQSRRNPNNLFKFWLVLNGLFVIFYGFVHQAGVFPVISQFSHELKTQPVTTKFHVFTSHVYSFPESFLLQTDPNKILVSNRTKYNVDKRCYIHEEGSTDLELVLRKIKITLDVSEVEAETKKHSKYKFYFVLPTSLEHHLKFLLDTERYDSLNAEKINSVYPHLSVESLPDFSKYCLDVLPFFKCKPEYTLPWYEYISNVVSLCGLDVYEISRM